VQEKQKEAPPELPTPAGETAGCTLRETPAVDIETILKGLIEAQANLVMLEEAPKRVREWESFEEPAPKKLDISPGEEARNSLEPGNEEEQEEQHLPDEEDFPSVPVEDDEELLREAGGLDDAW
jgi:hypothetical protein